MKIDVTECIFCGSMSVSEEHVWGDWLNQKFKSNNPKARVVHRIINGSPETPALDSRGRLDNAGSSLSRKFRAVCATCNNTWMSNIESSFKLVFEKIQENIDVSLSTVEIAATRNWCYLKLLIQQSIWISHRSLIHEAREACSQVFSKLREEFVTSRVAPKECNLFICRAQPSVYGPGAFTYNTAIMIDNGVHIHTETFSASLPNFGFIFFKNIPDENRSLNRLRLATFHGSQAATFRVLNNCTASIQFPSTQQALDFNLAEIAVGIMNDLGFSHFKRLGDF